MFFTNRNDPVIRYIKSVKLRNPMYELQVRKNRGRYYVVIWDKKMRRQAAHLNFNVNNSSSKRLYMAWGETYPNYRRQGLGEFLRALVTKTGKVVGSKYAKQLGALITPENIKRGSAGSSRILAKLGWRPLPKRLPTNMAYESIFNYNKNNLSRVNNTLNRYSYINNCNGMTCFGFMR